MKKLLTKDTSTSIVADTFYERVAGVIREARATVIRSIDTAMVKAYWHSGKYIVEEEQKGADRAGYGSELLKTLSIKLNQEFGKGFGVSTLQDLRKFYLAYPAVSNIQKQHAVRVELTMPNFSPDLSWTHYRTLMRISRLEARRFYEVEAIKNRWAARELERQINSLLFDRLAKSKDKEGLLH